MRKVHYKVVLDVLTTEDDDANGMEILKHSGFWLDNNEYDKIDVQDVTIESIKITDCR